MTEKSSGRQARRYDPVTLDGVTLHPVLTNEFHDWIIARAGVWDLLFAPNWKNVPGAFAAAFEADLSSVENGQEPDGSPLRAMLGLALALRIGAGLSHGERVAQFGVILSKKTGGFEGLEVTLPNGALARMTPELIMRALSVIARQNGLSPRRAYSIRENPDKIILAVSEKIGATAEEIGRWPILKTLRCAQELRILEQERKLDDLAGRLALLSEGGVLTNGRSEAGRKR